MTTISDPPGGGFRLSQLIYDTRYRSLTIQVVVMILLMLGFSYLISNMIANLSQLGRGFDLGFLSQRAGYDLGFSLFPVSSESTHGLVALAGLLNTLLVAFLGCILATVLGVIAGVLRLSKNWVVNKLMAVYVEGFRNVPLLLWIVLVFALATESTPSPRDFIPNDEGTQATFLLGGAMAVTNRGIYLPAPVPGAGMGIVVLIFIASLVGAFLWRRHARRQLFDHGRLVPVLWPVLAILILPTALAFLAFGRPLTFDYPALIGRPFTDAGILRFDGGFNIPNSLLALWIALSLYTGAFIAEIVRAGILAISKGQSEAAFSLGLPPGRTMNLIILPQALRVIVPPLISQFLNLTKNSSLAIAVTYPDIRATLAGTAITTTGKELEGMLLLGLTYLIISLIISTGMNFFNARTQLQER